MRANLKKNEYQDSFKIEIKSTGKSTIIGSATKM